MVLEGLLIIIMTPFLNISQSFQIMSYSLFTPFQLAILILDYRKYQSIYFEISKMGFSGICLIFLIESYDKTRNISLLFMSSCLIQMYLLRNPIQRKLIILILNFYFFFRILDWEHINFIFLIIGIAFILLVGYELHTHIPVINTLSETTMIQQMSNISIKKSNPEKSLQLMLNTPGEQKKNLQKNNWDSTYAIPDIQECMHFFNLIPEGFAMISPQNLQVQFCNQAALDLFKIQDKQDLSFCLEQLQEVIPTTYKEIKSNNNNENRDHRDSFPSFQSFHQSFQGGLNRQSVNKGSKHKISIHSKRHLSDSEAENQIIHDLRNVRNDKRYLHILKQQPYHTTQLGSYLANWFQRSGCSDLESPSKRLLEIYTNQTIIDDKVTILIQMRDVTHRDYIKLMRQQYKQKSNTLSFVSHEYRTPLNSIIQYMIALQDEKDIETQQRYIKIALNNSFHLLNLSNDLLDFAQFKAGKFSINPIEFDLRKLVEECLDMFRLQAQQKKIKLIVIYRNTVPQQIINDPNRIKQVIINLLGNAFKFTLQGYIELKICKSNSNIIKIEVHDTGIGVKDEDQDKLLKAFGRVLNEEHKKLNTQGVGLGLLISNMIAKNLNNNEQGLNFESVYNYGTTFSFNVALNIESLIQIEEESDEDYQISQESPERRKSLWRYVINTQPQRIQCLCIPILIVDDNSFNIDVLKMLIQKINPQLKLDCSLDGFQANQKVLKNKCQKCNGYKLIFMDIEMPRMNGYQTTQLIKKSNPNITIIGCSAYSQKIEERKALEGGMDGYIVKPIELDQLKSILDKII